MANTISPNNRQRGLINDFEYYYANLLNHVSETTIQHYQDDLKKTSIKHLSELFDRLAKMVFSFNLGGGNANSKTYTWNSFGYSTTEPLTQKHLIRKNLGYNSGEKETYKGADGKTRTRRTAPRIAMAELKPTLWNQPKLHSLPISAKLRPKHKPLALQLKNTRLHGKALGEDLFYTFGGLPISQYSLGTAIYKQGVTIRNNKPYMIQDGHQKRISWAKAIDDKYTYLTKNLPTGVKYIGNGRYTYYGKGGLGLANLINKYKIPTQYSVDLFPRLKLGANASDPVANLLGSNFFLGDSEGLLTVLRSLAAKGHPLLTPFVGEDLFGSSFNALIDKLRITLSN